MPPRSILARLAPWLFGGNVGPSGAITPEKLQHVFDWSLKNGPTGIGGSGGLGSGIEIKPRAEDFTFRRDWDGHKAGTSVHIPAHLKWYASPTFAYACLVDGRVDYRYTTKSKAVYDCPVTRSTRHIQQIDQFFAHWYTYFRLPESLAASTEAKPDLSGLSRVAVVRRYLSSGEDGITFKALHAREDILLWVDWRESDDDIVTKCEAIIQTGALSAQFVENAMSADLIITNEGKATRVPYKSAEADRDTTILTLNRILSGEYELRVCNESQGSDTLAFLPLSKAEWRQLDADYPEAVTQRFEVLSDKTELFG